MRPWWARGSRTELFEERQLTGAPRTGALTIDAAGPIHFANIYVPELE